MKNKQAMLCSPCGIRVWRGFRSRAFFNDREGFDKIIGEVFVPQTAQQMEPLGLCAYFPALLPDSIPPGSNDQFLKIPDEVALVVYPSKEYYQRAATSSVAGRAYSLLHWPFFNGYDPDIPRSQSGHPEPWAGTLDWDVPYYLVPDAIDWRSGVTHLLVARPLFSMKPEVFCEHLNTVIRDWLEKRERHINGSVIFACPEYLLYWEHREMDCDHDSLIPRLLPLLESPYLNSAATPVIVPPAFHEPDEGVNIRVGECLNVRVDIYKQQ